MWHMTQQGGDRWSEGSLVRRVVGPKGRWSEGSLVRRVVGPKKCKYNHVSECCLSSSIGIIFVRGFLKKGDIS